MNPKEKETIVQTQLGPSPSTLYETFRQSVVDSRRRSESPRQDTMTLLKRRVSVKSPTR
jgi:hypothetical protein